MQHNKQFHNLYCSPHIIKMMSKGREGQAVLYVCVNEKCTQNFRQEVCMEYTTQGI